MKLFKENELEELGLFYLVNFVIGAFAVAMPYAVIYFLDTGLSFLQISIMFAIFGVSTFVLEIPTGAFADEYSRKWSVVVGMIIVGISFGLIPLSNSFLTTLVLWSILGLGTTLVSGAEVAWVMDNLKFNKKKKN
ncbi:MFS transporter [Candidatus Woesearchaeota archaeon]|nr:MFS transporter [Candidatus Woesearchaeota archaeon]